MLATYLAAAIPTFTKTATITVRGDSDTVDRLLLAEDVTPSACRR
jgi:hypothetical protein